jgi:hypothetical protein
MMGAPQDFTRLAEKTIRIPEETLTAEGLIEEQMMRRVGSQGIRIVHPVHERTRRRPLKAIGSAHDCNMFAIAKALQQKRTPQWAVLDTKAGRGGRI